MAEPDLDNDDPYRVLGLPPDAGREEAKRAYRRLLKRYKPDHHPIEFQKIRQAYETIEGICSWDEDDDEEEESAPSPDPSAPGPHASTEDPASTDPAAGPDPLEILEEELSYLSRVELDRDAYRRRILDSADLALERPGEWSFLMASEIEALLPIDPHDLAPWLLERTLAVPDLDEYTFYRLEKTRLLTLPHYQAITELRDPIPPPLLNLLLHYDDMDQEELKEACGQVLAACPIKTHQPLLGLIRSRRILKRAVEGLGEKLRNMDAPVRPSGKKSGPLPEEYGDPNALRELELRLHRFNRARRNGWYTGVLVRVFVVGFAIRIGMTILMDLDRSTHTTINIIKYFLLWLFFGYRHYYAGWQGNHRTALIHFLEKRRIPAHAIPVLADRGGRKLKMIKSILPLMEADLWLWIRTASFLPDTEEWEEEFDLD